MNENCKQCGKPFPAGQGWCNGCEPDRAAHVKVPPGTQAMAGEPLSNPGPESEQLRVVELASAGGSVTNGLGTLFLVLFRIMAIFIGLVLIAGGGLLSLCGANAPGAGDTVVLVLFGLALLAIGGFLIYLAFSGKSKAKAVADDQETLPPRDAAP